MKADEAAKALGEYLDGVARVCVLGREDDGNAWVAVLTRPVDAQDTWRVGWAARPADLAKLLRRIEGDSPPHPSAVASGDAFHGALADTLTVAALDLEAHEPGSCV